MTGFEPVRISSTDFKSVVSAISPLSHLPRTPHNAASESEEAGGSRAINVTILFLTRVIAMTGMDPNSAFSSFFPDT